MSEQINIREATPEDFNAVMQIETLAFGQAEEAELVVELLRDETAQEALSLIAFVGDTAVGHILFSRVYFANSEIQPLMHILAPLAIHPDYQGKGIGGRLTERGLDILKTRGTELVFVLGHEQYYPKFGFIPDAAKFGFTAPFKIPREHSEAWMYLVLNKKKRQHQQQTIRCSDALNDPKYWTE